MRITGLFAALPLAAIVAIAACADNENPDSPGSSGGPGTDNEGGPGDPSEAGTGDGGPVSNTSVCSTTKQAANKDAGRVFKGTLLLPETAVDGELFIDRFGKIVCAAKSCSSEAGYAEAAVITCTDSVISPGLINSHDHISFANNTPKGHGTERYEHRHDWRKGIRGHTKISTTGGAKETAVLAAELRFVMSGATATASSGGEAGLLRNVDDPGLRESGLNLQPAFYDTFPLNDSDGDLVATGCTYTGGVTTATVDKQNAYLPHIAEGIDAPALNELVCTSDATGFPSKFFMKPQTAVIHGIAARPAQVKVMAAGKSILIWSPRSNIDLYGNTAPVVMYDHMGVPIALGTDWLPSGSMNIERELKCADELNQKHFGKHFTDKQLWQMVTVNAALATGMGHTLGKLQAGYTGDIAIFENKKGASNAYRAIIDSTPEDVVLVMRGGRTLYGDTKLLDEEALFGKECESIDVCGRAKKACVKKDVDKYTLDQVKFEGEKYAPLFECKGKTPPNEPTCAPSRGPTASAPTASQYGGITASDKDGDGVTDDKDNCPTIFNPIRPMDGDAQADADGDGIGDACDKCPLDTGETCTVLSGYDTDADGVPNGEDNCPKVSNTPQTDGDKDGKGAACDLGYDGTNCDDQANIGQAYCMRELSIETLRNPAAANHPSQYRVRAKVTGAYVTAVKSAGGGAFGFFIQAPTAAQWQGIFVATPGNSMLNVKVGNKVDVEGDYEVLFDLDQLGSAQWKITDPGTTLPFEPLVVDHTTYANKTGGEPWEGVLCKIAGPIAVSVQNADGTQDFDEFQIGTGKLRVDDYLYDPLDNTYAVGTSFPQITGICGFSFSNRKIWPRSNADLQ
jgi:cytosine/adenosine deaminase-related metal-dependent hydrolase